MVSRFHNFMFNRKGWIPVLFFILFFCFIVFLPTLSTLLLLSLFLSYAVHPLITFISEKLHIPRPLSTGIILLLAGIIAILLLLLVFPVVLENLRLLVMNIPVIIHSMTEFVFETSEWIGVEFNHNKDSFRKTIIEQLSLNSKPIVDSLSSAFTLVFRQTFTAVRMFFNFIIFIVVTFVFSSRFGDIKNYCSSLIPEKYKKEALNWTERLDKVLSGFIRGQLTVCFVLGSFYAMAFTFIGLKDGGSIGAMIGVMCIVPYVGIITGFIVSTLLGYTTGGLLLLAKVLFVFIVIQTVDTIFITPNIMGKRVGISPVFVIIALFAGAELGGVLGVLIAVPVFAVMKIISVEIIRRYKDSDFYTGVN